MTLLEFLYWSDWMLGMQVFLVLSVIVLIGLICLLLRAVLKLLHSDHGDDDPGGQLKQKIFDTLTAIKQDLEKTV